MTKQQQDLYMKIGIVAAAYLLVVRPLLNKLGITQSAQAAAAAAAAAAQQAANLAAAQQQFIAAGQKLSKPKAYWDQIAESIFHDLARYGAIDDNEKDAIYQLSRVNNDLDVLYLIQTYGKRPDMVFGVNFSGDKNLQDTINDNMSVSEINQVNTAYAKKNIKFRW